jgi:hypothetical protein
MVPETCASMRHALVSSDFGQVGVRANITHQLVSSNHRHVVVSIMAMHTGARVQLSQSLRFTFEGVFFCTSISFHITICIRDLPYASMPN